MTSVRNFLIFGAAAGVGAASGEESILAQPSPSLLKRMKSPAPRFKSKDDTDSSPEENSARLRKPEAGTSTAATVFDGTIYTKWAPSIAAYTPDFVGVGEPKDIVVSVAPALTRTESHGFSSPKSARVRPIFRMSWSPRESSNGL